MAGLRDTVNSLVKFSVEISPAFFFVWMGTVLDHPTRPKHTHTPSPNPRPNATPPPHTHPPTH